MASPHYRNFAVAVYTRVYEVNKMRDLRYLAENFEIMSRHVKIAKVYLETHRDMVVADEGVIRQAKEYLEARGVTVEGGITITVDESNQFETYCYTNPEHRRKLQELCAYTARLFDAFILDDFFFTSCKCPACIAAKGEQRWTDFRLRLMTEAAEELALAPARAANPNVKVTIKYPNWYEHFQGLGFNLETEPAMFDALYTGTETRDPVMSNQHLQPYESYQVFRYFENIKPGGNDGGWVDPFGSFYLDRYAEQLWLTLFAKAPEITLFDFRSLQRPITPEHRAPWQGSGASFDFDATVAPYGLPDGSLAPEARWTLAAGAAFELADRFLHELGNPIGVACYRPHHATTGEDFLHNYLGMLGIPIDLHPTFPAEAHTILLTEAAAYDPEIVAKIKRQLLDGKTVIVTSGLVRALQTRGFSDIVELHLDGRRAATQDLLMGFGVHHAERPITVPRIGYLTNDSWEVISCLVGVTGTPLFHSARYGNSTLYMLTIPDSFDDLYALPPAVLSRIKEIVTQDLFVRVDGPSQVALFAYDNGTFIVESFRDTATEVRLVVDERYTCLQDLVSEEVLDDAEAITDWRGQPTGKKGFALALPPHAFRAFRAQT
ncbi:MAG TPA: hypothetical protein GX714_17250 [Chloroflexi bacterium]|nr:hypothetical protein [Chloroflexota bacterium]